MLLQPSIITVAMARFPVWVSESEILFTPSSPASRAARPRSSRTGRPPGWRATWNSTHVTPLLIPVPTAFAPASLAAKRAAKLSARFAAKEAGAKALGTGISRGVTWIEFQVARQPGGRPVLELRGRAALLAGELGVKRISLSLTHTGNLAMATVMMEG